jgi:hypothetical protein
MNYYKFLRLRKFIFFSGLVLFQASYAYAQERIVFVLSGQSNMVGLASTDRIPESMIEVPSNVTYVLDGEVSDFSTNGNGRFGPEVSFAHEISAQWPEKEIVLIKYAVGGASLYAWSPEWTEEGANITLNANFGNLYSNLMDMISDQKILAPENFTAILWMQGERDARFPEAGTNYFENFSNLINHLRNDIGNPQLPFIFGQINPPASRYPALSDVRAAQREAIAAVPSTHMIATDDLTKLDDNLHYDADGIIEMGIRFARAFIDNYSIN